MLKYIKRLWSWGDFIKEVELVDGVLSGDYEPLLNALLNNEIKFYVTRVYKASSRFGLIEVVNDWFFYLSLRGKSIYNIREISHDVARRLACAAINSAEVGKAISDKEILEEYSILRYYK